MLVKVFGLAAAGALGTLSRVALSALVGRWLPAYPWGTLLVNVLGCFLFGLAWSLGTGSLGTGSLETGERTLSPELGLIVLGGFMGAFTTFSTYMFDTLQLGQNPGIPVAAGYFILQNVAGFGALCLGLGLGRWV